MSLLASPANAGYVMVAEGITVVAGGTSASAPSWAGIVAVLNDATHLDASGALNAVLYRLGREQYAGTGPGVFHDVLHGDNSFNRVLGYDAGAGYDLASGLGTPDVAVLAQALAAIGNTPTPTATPIALATLTSTSAPPTQSATPSGNSCAGDCNNDHAVTVDEVLVLLTISLGTANISTCGAGDVNDDGQITIDEILAAVNTARNGCAA